MGHTHTKSGPPIQQRKNWVRKISCGLAGMLLCFRRCAVTEHDCDLVTRTGLPCQLVDTFCIQPRTQTSFAEKDHWVQQQCLAGFSVLHDCCACFRTLHQNPSPGNACPLLAAWDALYRMDKHAPTSSGPWLLLNAHALHFCCLPPGGWCKDRDHGRAGRIGLGYTAVQGFCQRTVQAWEGTDARREPFPVYTVAL